MPIPARDDTVGQPDQVRTRSTSEPVRRVIEVLA